VLAPLILHVHELRPGEAIHTGPGILHAYLRGVGVELMTSSDNVLRGGLTAKHVDVPELLEVVRFEPQPPQPLRPAGDGGRRRFAAGNLVLDRLEVDDGPVELDGGRVSILLCTEGGGVLHDGAGPRIRFSGGDSFLLPAALEGVRATGPATLFRAGATDW
jgi:mannose-6-phosphate isomerase